MRAELGVMFAACAAMLLAGCDPMEPSPAERADRSSRSYTAAMAELQAGHVDTAIGKFEDVIRDEPGNGNAHFQLAALHEEKKDYLRAIVHYRLYMLIRPKSDKAAVAQDRMRGCETRYAAQLVEKAGAESKFAADLAKLRAECEQRGKKAAKLSGELEDAKRKIASLEKEVAMKKSMLERASALTDAPSTDPAKKRKIRPTDAELLDDETENDRRLSSSDIKSLRALLAEEDKGATRPKLASEAAALANGDEADEPPLAVSNSTATAANNPFAKKKDKKPTERLIPETYTVEEGDTLMRISAKFYGTNHKWRAIRDANKTVISPDGRVNAGQVIKLP